MTDYKWEHYRDFEVIRQGWLFAHNLHHAKHLLSLDAEVENKGWIHRNTCVILPLVPREYIAMFPSQPRQEVSL